MSGVQIGRFERLTRLVAWALPAGLALARASSHAQWRGDVGAVRDLALASVGWGGGLSTALGQTAALLPVGSQTFRTALISVLALAVAGRALFALGLALLRTVERQLGLAPSRFAAPALAAVSTLLATVSPSFQLEATVGGSTMLAVALGLWATSAVAQVVLEPALDRTRAVVLAALAAGALVGENAALAVVTVATSAAVLALWPQAPGAAALPYRTLARGWTFFLLGAAGSSLPGVLRAFAPRVRLDLGGPFLWGAALPEDPSRALAFGAAWLEEIGMLAAALALFGVASLLLGKRTRPIAAAIVVAVGADLLLRPFVGPTEGSRALRLFAFGWGACTVALGMFWLLGRLVRMKVPFARAGAALCAALLATVVALVIESSSELADRDAQLGADVFSDLALERLPPRATLVTDDSLVTWRLFAAQLVEGRRRDVLVVPRALVAKGDMASSLLAAEPKLEPLLLSLALGGSSDELSLTEIADARPLFVEPERGWDATVYSHLSVAGFWLRFEPEPLGPADRKLDVEVTLAQIAPLLAAGSKPRVDAATAVVATRCAQIHAKTLLRVGDLKSANAYLRAVDTPANGSVRAGKSIEVRFAAAVARLPQAEPSKKLPTRVIDESKVPGRARAQARPPIKASR